MEKFRTINQDENGIVYYKQVKGERVLINGLPCFIFLERQEGFKEYNVSHIETGMHVASDLSYEKAIDKATFNYERRPEAVEAGRKQLTSRGITMPVNV